MALMFGLRFDFRNPAIGGISAAERYAVGIEMVEWADKRGCVNVSISEHHSSPDGYLPSPLPVIAAMAARTESVRFTVAALIAPFYETIRLAEDMIVLDNLSKGRVDLIVAGGYVQGEFDMYGVPISRRGALVTEAIEAMRGAFSGEPFEHRGRTVHVTPGPFRPGGPALMLGGSSPAAARRAARIADGFLPSTPDVWGAYQEELTKLGKPDPGPCPIGDNIGTVALAEDPERAWPEMGPFFLHETNAYGEWLAANDGDGPYRIMKDVDEVRASGLYRILTPDELIGELRAAPFPFALFHPLCGGMPPALAWSSLHLFEEKVMPAFD